MSGTVWKERTSTSAESLLYTQTRLCWRLISISSKCWIPLNINHWTAEFIWTLTKLLSIICPSCASCAVYVVYLCNSYCLSRKVSILHFIGYFIKMYPLPLGALFKPTPLWLWSFRPGWQVMNRCLSCHWTLYQRRTWAGPTTSCATGSNWKRSSAGCADETRAWQRPWERPSPWAP